MEFNGINLKDLRNGEAVQFNTDIIDIVTANNPATLQVTLPFNEFVTTQNELSILYATDQGSDITPILQALDRRRDDAIIGIRGMADAYRYHYDPAKRAAGVSIIDNLGLYSGSIAQQSLIAETASIKNILQDWDTLPELMAAVAELQLDDWKTELQTANDLFHTQYMARNTEVAARNPNTILEKRVEAAQKYYTLRDTIGAYHLINNGINPWGKTVNEINNLIDQYNVLLASHSGQPEDNTPAPPPQQG